MRKLYLLSLLLPLWTLLPLWGPGGCLFAAVQVQTLSADYANKRITFALSWAAGTRNATHLSKVWVLVDYTTVTNPNTTGAWQRATVASATATSGTVTYDSSNRQGFFVQGTDGAFSSTVTVTLSSVPTKFNWCATATDYPPNVTATGGTYTLHGTAPFTLLAADGSSTQVVNGATIAASALTVAPVTVRDATGCPGVFCIYTGADLYIDATHACQQRTSGAQNWEAWIKDSRDNELYRIVLMPDNKWWLAQNVKLASYNGTTVGSAISRCTADECGRAYTCAEVYGAKGGTSGSTGNVQGICPNGWLLPIRGDLATMANAISTNQSTACAALIAYNHTCASKNDAYGWASIIGINNGSVQTTIQETYTNDAGREDGFYCSSCSAWEINDAGECDPASVRCFRIL